MWSVFTSPLLLLLTYSLVMASIHSQWQSPDGLTISSGRFHLFTLIQQKLNINVSLGVGGHSCASKSTKGVEKVVRASRENQDSVKCSEEAVAQKVPHIKLLLSWVAIMSSLVSSENGTAHSPVLAILSTSVQLPLILVTAILRVEIALYSTC